MAYSENIKINKIDRNFISGSAETFRKLVGGTYSIAPATGDGAVGEILELDYHESLPTAGPFHDVKAYEFSPMIHKIKYIQMNIDLRKQTSTGPLFRYQYPVRIIGDNETIANNQEWKTILLGGVYGEHVYEKIFTEGIFDSYGHTYDTYYYQLEKNKLDLAAERGGIAPPSFNFYDIGYRYNSYLRIFQNHIQNLDEKQLPNIYFHQMYKLSVDTDDAVFAPGIRPQFEAFVSRENTVDLSSATGRDPHAAKDVQLSYAPPPYILSVKIDSSDRTSTGEYKDKALYLREYLTGAYVRNDLTEETINYIDEKTQNLYFTSGSLRRIINKFQDESSEDHIPQRYPMYARISFPIHAATDKHTLASKTLVDSPSYTKIISDCNLQEEVLSYIRGSFVGDAAGNSSEALEFQNRSFFYKTNNTSTSIHQVTSSFEQNSNAVDLFQMFVDIAENNEVQEENDEFIVTSDNDEIVYARNQQAAFRYQRTKNSLKALEEAISSTNNQFNSDFMLTSTAETNFVEDIANKILLNSTEHVKPEVVAYRIEKVGGPPVGESVTARRKIQDIYLFNDYKNGISKDGTQFTYYDTQVKYGEEYTYSVYAYMIVPGVKYKYSDLRISQLIGKTLLGDPDAAPLLMVDGTATDEVHCLRFTDAYSSEIAEQLINTETNILTSIESPMVYPFADAVTGAITEQGRAFLAWCYVETGYIYGLADETTHMVAALNSIFSGYYGTITSTSLLTSTEFLKIYKDWCRLNETYTIPSDASGGTSLTIGSTVDLLDDSSASTLFSNSTIKSSNKYLADFHFDIEPGVKLIQVPLTSHTFRVLDHPPVACDVSPYQRKDNSNIIGFYINKESPSLNSNSQKKFQSPNSKYGLYPTPITPGEEEYKSDYMTSNSNLQQQIIYNYSVSPETKVNVYRIDYKPQTLKDFDNNLVFQKRLSAEHDYDYNHTNCFYEEAVKANKKYYYLFKFENANGTTGYVSPIQVAELVDDGGYKYAVFDTMFETDLVQYNPKQVTTSFKKLLHILPNPRHTEIQREGINRSDDPLDLIVSDNVRVGSADELIWGKKFKFRITSKKTGKKIDLNVKYNLGN